MSVSVLTYGQIRIRRRDSFSVACSAFSGESGCIKCPSGDEDINIFRCSKGDAKCHEKRYYAERKRLSALRSA